MEGRVGELAQALINALNRLKPENINSILCGVININMTKQLLIASLSNARREKGGEWKGMTMGALAGKMGVSKPAMTKIVDELEEKDLIERRIYRADRRNTYIVFTERGENRVREFTDRMNGMLEELSEEIGEEDIRTFIRLCGRFQEALRRFAEKHKEEHAFTL